MAMSGSFATPFFDASADNTAQTIKASAGQLYAIEAQNPNLTAAYIQFYDATSPVVGTTTPVLSLYVPASGAMDKCFSVPVEFSTAIKYAVTTTATGSTGLGVGLVFNATFG
jgi:hypothetical protein